MVKFSIKRTLMPVIFVLVFLTSGCSLFLEGIDDYEDYSPPREKEDLTKKALELALGQMGSPYHWGSRGPNSFDCSGLIVWAYRQVFPGLMFRYEGYQVPDATMDSLWRYNVEYLDLENIRPGDIIFITSDPARVTHGGLFIGWVNEEEMEIVHASSAMGGVVRERWPVQGLKRGQWFHGAGRLEVLGESYIR